MEINAVEAMCATLTPEQIASDPANVEELVKAFRDARAELSRVETALKDPVAVHVNMLRGSIAVPQKLDGNLEGLDIVRRAEEMARDARRLASLCSPVRMTGAGEVTELQRDTARASELYRHGDCILQWVNEGDMFNHHMLASLKKQFEEKWGV